jgi:hypothetical protein
MLSPNGSITIRFVKDENKDDDDIATIRPTGRNMVTLTFKGVTETSASLVVQSAIEMSTIDCMQWFQRATRLLNTDDYPIHYVQCDFPSCPAVMYRLENLDDHVPAICEMFAWQFGVWNKQPTIIPVPFDALNTAFVEEDGGEAGAAAGRHYHQNKGRHHLFFDE